MKNRYWVESSFDHEDEDKEHKESLIVVVDYGDAGTESVVTFDDTSNRENLEYLVKHFNESK
jgi:hypothetical protein